jgi:hypothetical protein
MMQSTLTLDGIYASAMGEDTPEYETPEGAAPGQDADTADLDGLLGSYGTWSPLAGAPEGVDAEAVINSAILAGLVTP